MSLFPDLEETVRLRTSDIAYKALLEQILTLQLKPGSVVNEQPFSKELGLGRMPIREAIARLATDRFVTVLPRRGAVISSVSLDDAVGIFDAREAIECGVAYVAARRATTSDVATLRTMIDATDIAREATDHEAFLQDDHAIHVFLLRMVRNPLLQDAGERLLQHNLRFWRMYWGSRPAQNATMFSHRKLLEALEAHDSEGAEKAMREHLAASRQLLQNSL